MIDGIGIRDRAGSLGVAILEALSGAGRWTLVQVRAIVDLPRWRAASSISQRAEAISWLRLSVFAGLFAGFTLIVLATCGVFRHKPGPGPLPTERELHMRAEALAKFRPTPPPGLVEANRSAPQPRSGEGTR